MNNLLSNENAVMNKSRQDTIMRLLSNGSPFKSFLGEMADHFIILLPIPFVPPSVHRTPASSSSSATTSSAVTLTTTRYNEFIRGVEGVKIRYVLDKFMTPVGKAVRLSNLQHEPQSQESVRTCIVCSAKTKKRKTIEASERKVCVLFVEIYADHVSICFTRIISRPPDTWSDQVIQVEVMFVLDVAQVVVMMGATSTELCSFNEYYWFLLFFLSDVLSKWLNFCIQNLTTTWYLNELVSCKYHKSGTYAQNGKSRAHEKLSISKEYFCNFQGEFPWANTFNGKMKHRNSLYNVRFVQIHS